MVFLVVALIHGVAEAEAEAEEQDQILEDGVEMVNIILR